MNTVAQKLNWTRNRDDALLALRASGGNWVAIAAVLGISSNAANERGRRLGARLPPRICTKKVTIDPDRPALPAGHPSTWGVITQGTVLESMPYPIPPPIGRERTGVLGETC